MTKALLHNGKFIDRLDLGHDNRVFRYGDAVFETIRVRDGQILWWRYHSQRLRSSMRLLKIDWREELDSLRSQLEELIHKNGILEGGRIRLTVYREDGGLYTPLSNKANYFAEAIPLKDNTYMLNEQGIKAGYFDEHKKASTQLSRIKTANSLVYVLAGIHAQKKGYDDVFLINQEGRIAEGSHSNLWIIKDGMLITPSLSEGALYGVMRRGILSNKIGKAIVEKLDLSICESVITKEDIQQAEEVFLSNSIQGIQWVEKVGRRKYSSKKSQEIIEIINTFAQAELKINYNYNE